MELVSEAHEAAPMLGPSGDQLTGQAELLAQAESALLAREEAVRCDLDDEAVDVLGPDLPAQHDVALEQGDPRFREERLEPPRRGQPRDPATDHGDSHAATRTFARTSPARAAMKTGSSFSAGGRSNRTPRSAAAAAARWSRSNRISTWSDTNPTGTETTSRTPRFASSARCSPMSGPAQGSGV